MQGDRMTGQEKLLILIGHGDESERLQITECLCS
ncbi:unnamed protein product, partial [marine sediment metagenome]